MGCPWQTGRPLAFFQVGMHPARGLLPHLLCLHFILHFEAFRFQSGRAFFFFFFFLIINEELDLYQEGISCSIQNSMFDVTITKLPLARGRPGNETDFLFVSSRTQMPLTPQKGYHFQFFPKCIWYFFNSLRLPVYI